MSEPLVQLNANWRVADDPPQWTIEQRKGSGWRARKFIRNRDHLLKRIAELCGDVDPDAIETIRSWPNSYVTWKAMEMQGSGGPETAPRSAITLSGVPEHPEPRGAPVSTSESVAVR